MLSKFFRKSPNPRRIIKEENINITKNELLNIIEGLQSRESLKLTFDLSSLNNEIITGYEIDLTEPDDPKLKITYGKSI